MAFQSFIQDRGFKPAQVADKTNKILNRASSIIEQNQAVSEIEFQQQANLINNLRSQRQREAQINSENHQLMMESLQAAETARSTQAQIDITAAQQAQEASVKREQNQIEGILSIVKSTTSFVEEQQKKEEEETKKEFTDLYQRVFNNPDEFAEQALAINVKLSGLNDAELADAARAVALSEMGPRSGWEGLLFNQNALEAFGTKIATAEAINQLVDGGGLDTLIYTKPETEISFLSNGQPKTVKLGEIKDLPDNIEYRAAMNALVQSQMKPIIGDNNPVIAAEHTKKVQNYINSQVVLRNRQKATKGERVRLEQRQSLMFENGGISAHKYISQTSIHPNRTSWDAKQDVVKNLKFSTNPRQVFEELGAMPDFANPGQTIGRKDPNTGQYKDIWYNQLHKELISIEQRQSQAKAVDARVNGKKLGQQAGELSVRDGRFSETELQQSQQRLLDMVQEGLMSGEEYRYANEELSAYYNDFSDKKRVLEQLENDKNNYQLDTDQIRDLLKKGVIDTATATAYLEEAAKQAQPDEVSAFGYGTDQVYKRFLEATKQKVRTLDVSGVPSTHYSAVDAAVGARADYLNEVRLLTSKGMSLAEAQRTAFANVSAAIDAAKEGTKYQITSEDLKGGKPFYNRYTPGNHPNSYTATEPDLNAPEIGRRISNQPELLKDSNFTDLDGQLIGIARQISKGVPVRLPKFAEDAWKASGLGFDEFWNPLLNRENSPYKGMKVTPGSYGELQKQVEEKNPELSSFFDNLTSERKNVLLEQTNSNLISSDIGLGRPFFYGAQSSVRRMNIANGNENIVAAIAYLRTDGGTKPTKSLPELYKSIVQEYGLQNYQPPEALIASLPPAIQRDVSNVLQLTNSNSTQHLPGMSSNNVRIASTARTKSVRDEVFRGAAELGIDPSYLAMVMNFESGGNLISGSERHGLDTYGGDGNNYLGWIQFSPDNQRKYGVKPGMNANQMMNAVIGYLRDSGVRPGDSLATIYQAIQAPKYVDEVRKTGVNVGSDSNGTVSSHLQRIQDEHSGLVNQWLQSN